MIIALPRLTMLKNTSSGVRRLNSRTFAALAIRKDRTGRPEFIQIASKTDGKDHPQYQSVPLAQFQIDGTVTPLTYAETVVDERTIEATAKFNGQVINKGTRRISADGKTMTLDVIAYGANGQETPILLVFDRRGD